MRRRMQIRKKILFSTLALMVTLIPLGIFAWQGVSGYRGLTIDLEGLSKEITSLQDLEERVEELKDIALAPSTPSYAFASAELDDGKQLLDLQSKLKSAAVAFQQHRERIASQQQANDPLLATTSEELTTMTSLIDTLGSIHEDLWKFGSIDRQHRLFERLRTLTENLNLLSSQQSKRMLEYRTQAKLRYRSWQVIILFCAITSVVNVAIMFSYFRHSVVKPFKQLLGGSQQIADGDFEHRIDLPKGDELGDLAEAMNDMTERFVQIRDNLNEQVRQRTQEVVRSEQLASVGFLAAGVAHEINNPIASIAWSAEALESRFHEVIHDEEGISPDNKYELNGEQIAVVKDYLRRIQDEAFRCKGITERLLDFSRLGESSRKQETDIHEAVSDVCELVKHLGQYRNRKLRYSGTPGIHAWVSPTEFKQVVLNLLTNALDASEDGAVVEVSLDATSHDFSLSVVDQGCGMTEEVAKHLFEPFFTRRRDGRGTGLGLSISYRIVQDHGGTLTPFSAGPGAGTTMQLTLPLQQVLTGAHERRQAA